MRIYGSIDQMPSGRWRVRIPIAGQVVLELHDTQEAAHEARRALSERKASEESQPRRARAQRPRITFGEVAPELLAQWEAGVDRVRTASTRAGYRRVLAQVLAAGWRDSEIGSTTPTDVDRYVERMRAARLSSSSIRQRLDMLSVAMRLAVRRRYLLAAPCEIERPRLVTASQVHFASEPEVSRLLEAVAGDAELTLVALLAADAGLRRSEIPRLRWSDVRLGEAPGDVLGWIHLAVRGEEDRTKSGRGRDVPVLTRRLATALAPARFGREDRITRASAPATLSDRLAPAWAAAIGGFPHLHALRRRFASRLVNEAGISIRQAQLWLGHSSVTTTERYVRPDARPRDRALSAREALEGAVEAAGQMPI